MKKPSIKSQQKNNYQIKVEMSHGTIIGILIEIHQTLIQMKNQKQELLSVTEPPAEYSEALQKISAIREQIQDIKNEINSELTAEQTIKMYKLDNIKAGVRYIIEESEKRKFGMTKASIKESMNNPDEIIEHLTALGYFEEYVEQEQSPTSIKLPTIKKKNQ
jgi:hypothetical protein